MNILTLLRRWRERRQKIADYRVDGWEESVDFSAYTHDPASL